MNLNELIEQFHKLNNETENTTYNKSIKRVLSLLEEIEQKDMTIDQKVEIQARISPFLEKIQTQKEVKIGYKKLRKSLIQDFGFAPSNHYLVLGIGFGLALGTALGVSFGVPFENGIVFGQMIGSGTGLIGGLIVGMFLDKKKESKNLVLKNL